jgi:hypothetical protein
MKKQENEKEEKRRVRKTEKPKKYRKTHKDRVKTVKTFAGDNKIFTLGVGIALLFLIINAVNNDANEEPDFAETTPEITTETERIFEPPSVSWAILPPGIIGNTTAENTQGNANIQNPPEPAPPYQYEIPDWSFSFVDAGILLAGGVFCGVMIYKSKRKGGLDK